MTTGTFAVGETVVGTNSDGKELIRFRVAQSNHKRGPIDAPSQTYGPNPYYQFTSLFGTSVLEQQGARLALSAPIVDTITPNVRQLQEGIVSGGTPSIRYAPGEVPVSDITGASNIVNVPELYSSTSVI